MAGQIRLGWYNPQLSDISTLETLLVGHHVWLDDLVKSHQNAKTLTLLQGTWGSGKSHLLRLFEHRANGVKPASTPYQVINLSLHAGEIGQLIDLLALMLEKIHYPAEELLQLSDKTAQTVAIDILQKASEQQRLIFLVEHLDIHLEKLGEKAAKQLFNTLNTLSNVGLLATSTKTLSVPSNIELTTHQLPPLTLTQAGELMGKVAQIENKSSVVKALSSPKGQISIKALHHLAEGIPRYYIMFAQAIRHDPFEEFEDIVLGMLDNLSVQHALQFAALASQQQKLLQFIAKQPSTISVGDIAHHNRITHQTTSGQLKKLKDQGFLVANPVGRNSHYELAQPLVRMTLGLTAQNFKTVEQSLSFLRHWYASNMAGYQAKDGQCFVYEQDHLAHAFEPKEQPFEESMKLWLFEAIAQLPELSNGGIDSILKQLDNYAEKARNDLSEHAQQDLMHCWYSLIYHCLSLKHLDHAQLLGLQLFDYVEQNNKSNLWKQLSRYCIAFSAWFAAYSEIEQIVPWLSRLEKQETKLSSQAFSIAMCHSLVNKTKGYALIGAREKTQQALDQLRIRAEKRNSLEIAAAFCHGVNQTMTFIAGEDDKLALKLLRQVQDMSNKYHLEDLYFACASRVWSQNPDILTLEHLLKRIDTIEKLDGFSFEVYFMMHALAMQPLAQQMTGYVAIWHRITELNQEQVYAAALNQVSVALVKHAPKRYELWLHGCQTLLDNEASLQHSKRLLQALQQYLQNGCDKHQLLQLPKEERALVLNALA